jgi:hypothetical protein
MFDIVTNEDKDEDEDVQVNPDDNESYVPDVSLDDKDEDEDDAVGGNNDNAGIVGEDKVVEGIIDAEDVGEDEEVEVEGVETNTKNQNHHYETWVNNYNDVVSYFNTNGDCQVTRDFATAEGRMSVNWVHDQRKKFKNGVLSDDRINLLSDLQFDFSMQTNVVGANLTVPFDIISFRFVLVDYVLIHLVNIVRYIRNNILLVTVGTPVSMVFTPQFSVLIFQKLLSNTILHEVNLIRITVLFTNIVCTTFVLLVNQYISIVVVTFRLSSHYKTTTHDFLRSTPLFTNIVCTAFILLVNQCTSVVVVTSRLSSNYRTTTPTRMVIINCS